MQHIAQPCNKSCTFHHLFTSPVQFTGKGGVCAHASGVMGIWTTDTSKIVRKYWKMMELLFCFIFKKQLPWRQLFLKKNIWALQPAPFPNLSPSWSLNLGLVDFSLQLWEALSWHRALATKEGCGVQPYPFALAKARGDDLSAWHLIHSFQQLSKVKINWKCKYRVGIVWVTGQEGWKAGEVCNMMGALK